MTNVFRKRQPWLPKKRWIAPLLASMALVLGTAGGAWAQNANSSIHPNSIEIDASANLIDNTGLNDLIADWIKDANAHTQPEKDAAKLTGNLATGVVLGVSGAAQTGHWNGIRIVDGIGNADKDIFLNGGKENDTSSWNVGPGSVGSSKYDITQAYLANNNGNLYFGMERRGNNGTTAFDFEFNQAPPQSAYVPTRTVGDVLFTFEMNGSGSSGSATTYVYKWNGTQYVSVANPVGAISSINQNTTTASAPWGRVDSKGQWVLTNFDRFEFAEATVPFGGGLLPGVTSCGGNFYVQVRTRSSAVDTSDLKDTTRVFGVTLGGPTADADLRAGCGLTIDYDGIGTFTPNDATDGSKLGDGSPDNGTLTYNWTFYKQGVNNSRIPVGTATGATGSLDVGPNGTNTGSGNYEAELTVTEGGVNGCTSPTVISNVVSVTDGVAAAPTLTPKCDLQIDYNANASGGNAPYTYSWEFKNASGTVVGTSTTASGTWTAPGAGTYTATVNVNDTAIPGRNGGASCPGTGSAGPVTVYTAVGGTASLVSDCTDTITGTASGSGGNGSYTYSWKLFKDGGTSPVTTGSGNNPTFSGLAKGTYHAEVTIQDTQNGLTCKIVKTTGNVEVNPLPDTITIEKVVPTEADVDNLTLKAEIKTDLGTGPGTTNLQWQHKNSAGNWVNITGKTVSTLTLTLAEFKTLLGAEPSLTDVSHGGLNYKAKIYKLEVRLHVERTLAGRAVNSEACKKDSNVIPVAVMKAVDP